MEDETPVPVERLTAVIPNWETADLSIRCVEALVADGVPRERIVVVDNGSRDGSYERLREALPGSTVVRFEENVGYARAANHGARQLEGDAYMPLNNDAFVQAPGSVRRMLEALARPGVGVVVPRLLNEDGTLQRTVRPLDDTLSTFVRATGLSRFVPNRWQPRVSTYWDHAVSQPVRAADGPVLLIRRDLWHALGGFVERTVMHGEDTHLCWHARRRGWTVWFEREAQFVHLGNVSASRHYATPMQGELIGLAEGGMLREHLPPASSVLALAFTELGLAARWLAFGAAGRRERAQVQRALMRGYLAGFRSGRARTSSR